MYTCTYLTCVYFGEYLYRTSYVLKANLSSRSIHKMINTVNQSFILHVCLISCHKLILHNHYINIHNLSPILHNLEYSAHHSLLFCIIAIYKYPISYMSYNHTHKSQNKLFCRCVSELHLFTVNMYNPVYMYYLHLLYVLAHDSYYYFIILQAKDIWEGNLGWGTKLLITHMVEQMIIFYNCGVKYPISVITTIKFDFNILKCPFVTKISSYVYEPCLCFDISCLNINIMCYSSGYSDSVAAFFPVSFYLYVCNMFTLHDQWKSTLICLYTNLVLHITTSHKANVKEGWILGYV